MVWKCKLTCHPVRTRTPRPGSGRSSSWSAMDEVLANRRQRKSQRCGWRWSSSGGCPTDAACCQTKCSVWVDEIMVGGGAPVCFGFVRPGNCHGHGCRATPPHLGALACKWQTAKQKTKNKVTYAQPSRAVRFCSACPWPWARGAAMGAELAAGTLRRPTGSFMTELCRGECGDARDSRSFSPLLARHCSMGGC